MNDAFSRLHPSVSFVFFAAVISFSMFINQPVCLCISLICAFFNAAFWGGRRTVLFALRFLLPVMLLAAAVNPLFNHQGATILAYLPWDGNPLTLESVVFGLASAAMLCSAVLWFSSFNKVFTSDKVVYLFGKAAPAVSLLLSMSLRFIPRFIAQFKQINSAQKNMKVKGKKSLTGRIKAKARVFSTVLSLAMEDSIEISDSMKGRGYGLKGRTAYSLFRFNKSDAAVLSAVSSMMILLLVIALLGNTKFRYFPTVKGEILNPLTVLFYIVYFALMITPLVINIGEGIKWKRSASGI